MKKNYLKLAATAFIVVFAVGITFLGDGSINAAPDYSDDEELITLYKTKCALCHGPTALKLYDPELPMEEQVHAILEGKKGKKPPPMPAYKDKGIDAEKAQFLVEHMKTLRTPPE